jgi:hypothetical protein
MCTLWFLNEQFCHLYEWLQMGFILVAGYIEHLQIGTTRNYSTLANSHNLQFTTANTTSLSLLCFHQSLPGDISTMSFASVLTFISAGDYPTTYISLWTAQITMFLSCYFHCCDRVCWDVHVMVTKPLPSNCR